MTLLAKTYTRLNTNYQAADVDVAVAVVDAVVVVVVVVAVAAVVVVAVVAAVVVAVIAAAAVVGSADVLLLLLLFLVVLMWLFRLSRQFEVVVWCCFSFLFKLWFDGFLSVSIFG